MDKLFSFLIKHKYIVIVLFVAACVPAVMGMGLSKTNFEISTFLPKGAGSIEGSRIEADEFSSGAQAYVLIEDAKNWRLRELKEDIEDVSGVESAQWLGDALDTYTPEEFLSQKALSQFKKGSSSIIIITLRGQMGDVQVDEAVSEISELMEQGEYFGGSPVVINELKRLLRTEQPVYLAIACAILILILAVSLSSYIAPLLCLMNIGAAILLNYGTNFLARDSVSFLTVAIAAILQLAISMDFSIFLIHRFEEDLEKTGVTEAAMVSAMHKTLVTISSSALTDCAGFLALVFMQNQIGADLGIVLCKGVAFSLITSLTLLPCLILATYGLGKKKHRALLPSFKKLSGPLVKLRYVLLIAVAAVFVPAFIGSGSAQYYYTTENFMPDDTAPVIATNKISDTFGTTDMVNVLYRSDMAKNESIAAKEMEGISGVREVTGLFSSAPEGVPETFLPEQLKEVYAGSEYRRIMVTLESTLDNNAIFTAIYGIKSIAAKHLGEAYVTGSEAVAADMASTAKEDNLTVELISMAFIFIIVLIAFKSLLIPVMLVMVIKAAIFINVGINSFTGQEMIYLTPVFVGAIQLGATVDYAILFTSRYFEERHRTPDAKLAARQAIVSSTRPLLTSILTFFFATLSITIVSSIKATREIATIVGRGAIISYVVIMFALPALFVLFDRPLMAATWEFRNKKKLSSDNEGMMVS